MLLALQILTYGKKANRPENSLLEAVASVMAQIVYPKMTQGVSTAVAAPPVTVNSGRISNTYRHRRGGDGGFEMPPTHSDKLKSTHSHTHQPTLTMKIGMSRFLLTGEAVVPVNRLSGKL